MGAANEQIRISDRVKRELERTRLSVDQRQSVAFFRRDRIGVRDVLSLAAILEVGVSREQVIGVVRSTERQDERVVHVVILPGADLVGIEQEITAPT